MLMKTARLSVHQFGFAGLGLALLLTIGACASGTGGGPGAAGTTGSGGGAGTISCSGGQMACSGGCIDTSADSNNCGGCGIPCLGGHVCQSSVCVCGSGTMECNGSCVASDATHCGTCTNVCQNGQLCSGGQCTSMCTGTTCGTACCTGTQVCMNNACVEPTGTGGTTGGGGVGGGAAGTSGTAGRGGNGGSTAGTTGTAGRGGTTGSGGSTAGTTGTAGTGGTAPAGPKLITSSPSGYWTTTGAITMVTSGTANVTVSDTTSRQTWEGFGGAFNEAGWSQLMKLSQADRDRAMKLLFDGTDGAHFVMGRIPIGASDYALTRYTPLDTANDTALNSFSISRDMMYLIPYVNAAKAVNGSIRFWASPWTVPPWMKTRSGTAAGTGTSCGNPVNGSATDSNTYDGGCMQDMASYLTALAGMFVKWIQAYNGMGIQIDTLAPQNEPNYAQGYPSAIWAPALYAKFLPMLKSALTAASLNTKIMLGTMSNGDEGANSKDLQVVKAVMADASAKTVPTVMGLQWGMLDLYEGKTSGISPSTFTTGSMPVWATEHKCGNYPWMSGYKEPAPNDQAYAVESWGYIVDAINKGGVTAYNAWNMVLDPSGKGNDLIRQWSQDSLLVVNGTSLVLTPTYHVFRHASQYVSTGAKVASNTSDTFLAFKNPNGSVVAVVYNSGGANANYIVSIKGQRYQFSMPGTGWATVVVP